jgi:acetyl esterase
MALHLFIKKMLDSARAANRPALSAGTPEQARDFVAASRSALGAGPEVGVVRDLTIPTRGGKVTARLYRTQSQDEPGLVVYFHGGGWVCGSIDDFEVLTRAWTQKSGCQQSENQAYFRDSKGLVAGKV